MRIEDGNLVVTVDGIEQSVLLPEVAADAVVHAWAVPGDYRGNGLFVAVTERGEMQEIPACDPTLARFLGTLELPATPAAKLAQARRSRLAAISAACDAAVAALAAAYPEREIQSWPQQVKEAEALAANPEAEAPLLAAIADARALPVAELAERVLAKMVAYAAASGALIGRRQAAEDLIDLAETLDDLAGIHFAAAA